ncbi:AfsR/SARP family transcriptional regulator [Micromonospora echinofusca]|uniref:OmpR/PhoB-type domain-containing protein n=1 Tax=Micromonospora echinofusca TaxID=47858 RepID=A0ABS3VKB6_MICEH|nr:AfsR/SARP family transcriptional regulator [Micromonospora echinofusca]MBO4204972.1 hypothetical protein [Micromonospora echinofusca]
MRVAVLGPLTVQVGGEPLRLAGRRQQALVAALAVQPRTCLPARALTARVWPDRPAPAATALHVLVHRVRRRLSAADPAAGGLLRNDPPGYRLDLPDGGCDLDDLRYHARQAETAVGAGRLPEAADAAARALALVRGAPCAGLWSDADRWPELVAAAEEVRAIRRTAFTVRLRLGDHAGVLPEIEPLARAEPTCEWLHDLLMRALYLAGRQHDAVAVYTRLRAALAGELGLDPGPGVRRTYRMILEHDPALLPVASPATPTPAAADRAPVVVVAEAPLRAGIEALRRAGTFAVTRGGYRDAIDCYRSLLGLQEDPVARAETLLRLGEARYHESARGEPELAAAAALFRQCGEPQRAAEALSWRARARWLTPPGDGQRLDSEVRQVLDLVDPAHPSAAGAAALTNVCGLLAVTGRTGPAVRAGRLAVDWADRLDLPLLGLRVRSNLAIAALDEGDRGAVDDLAAVLDGYRSRSGWVPPAAWVNLADAEDRVGRLAAARRHRAAATRAAGALGGSADLPWLTAESVQERYQQGRWDEAERLARMFLTGPGQEHRMAAEVQLVLARIALARAAPDTARRHADVALRLARLSGARAVLGPALALQVRLAVRAGGPTARVRAALDELLDLVEGTLLPGAFGADLPLALTAAGLAPADLARHAPADSPWLRAARAVLTGQPDRAVLIYRRMGSPGDARQLTAPGASG